jgi:hypothetical protein
MSETRNIFNLIFTFIALCVLALALFEPADKTVVEALIGIGFALAATAVK